MSYDPNNIFAKILRGEAPCIKVYEDDHTLSFMDVMPQAVGHTLVVPKAPAQDLLDLPEDMAGPLMETTQKIAKAVKGALKPTGVLIAQLNGAAAGQTVFHLHFHVIPREEGLDLKLHAREMADLDELQQIADKIKAAL